MAQRAALINGAQNLNRDKDFAAMVDAIYGSTTGVSLGNGLLVTTDSVAAGRCLIKCTRTSTTPNETLWVVFENTAAVSLTTTGQTKKIWVEISQARINDATLNVDAGGLGIGVINSGANYPSSNYIPLATVTAGVITDDRPGVIFGSHIVTGLLKLTEGTPIASATTTNLATATGNSVHITGTTTITGLGTLPAGTMMLLTFDGILTFTHNATSLIIPGASNVTTAAGDQALVKSEGSGNWRVVNYTRANGTALVATTDINGLSTVSTLAEVDKLVAYSVSNAANRGITMANFRLLVQEYGGNGADGAVDGTADITITGSNNTHIVKNYTSWAAGNAPSQAYTNDPAAGSSIVLNMSNTSLFAVNDWVRVTSSAGADIAQVTAVSTNVSITVDTLVQNHTTSSPLVTRLRKLTITPTGCTLEIRVSGNCDISNWYLDFKGKGSLGGTPSTSGATALGVIFNGQGGNTGVTGSSAQPTAQVAPIWSTTPVLTRAGLFHFVPGAGGGAGAKDNSQSESGGNGGGGVYFQVRGTLTFSATTTVIDLRGNDGTNSFTYGGAGGGGGGGTGLFGSIGAITGSPITKLTGGTGSGTGTFLNYQCSGANGGNSMIGAGGQGAANMGVGGNGATGLFSAQNV